MSDKKRLFENFISLTILQGANYILPLITFPYLVRILGPEKFGLISFSQAFIQYFILITDYGFNLTATRQISINRNDKKKISQILSSVLTIKLFFMILSLLLLYVTVSLFDKFKYHSYIYFYTFGIVIGNVLFPVWFFQGLEKMKYITVLNISTRLISMLCIFIFIREVSDFKYVPIINSVASILIGCVSIFIVFSKFKVCYSIPSLKMIKEQLIEGWYVFISSIATSLYTISNTFILGLFTNNVIVGYYASGEKLVKAVQGLIQPVSQTIYPYINNLAQQSKERALTFISKIFCGIGIVTFATSLFLFYFSHILVNLVLGTKYEESIIIVKILSFYLLLLV